MDKNEIKRDYQIFNAVMFSTKFSGAKIQSIKSKIQTLCGYLYGHSFETEHRFVAGLINLTKEFAVNELFYHYMTKGHYKKFDDEHSLSTWIVQYIYLNINNLLRRYRPRPLNEDADTRYDVCDVRNKNFTVSTADCEDWLFLPSEQGTPEEILMAKQLIGLMYEHFNRFDISVMFGEASIQEVITQNNWNYDQYTQSLCRRRKGFRAVLRTHGYDQFH